MSFIPKSTTMSPTNACDVLSELTEHAAPEFPSPLEIADTVIPNQITSVQPTICVVAMAV